MPLRLQGSSALSMLSMSCEHKLVLWISINTISIPRGQMNIAFEACFVKSNQNKTIPNNQTSRKQPVAFDFGRVVFACETTKHLNIDMRLHER